MPVVGDLRRPLLGVETERVAELRGKIDHFFHLAAIYDMTAPAEQNTAVNVGGTTHAVELARALEAGLPAPRLLDRRRRLPTRARSTEEMFDEGQRLPSPYHRTKFESERIVREQPYVPWRVYRPGIVVGDSLPARWTRSTGPTTSSRRSSAPASCCRSGLPLVGLDLGNTNVVPVDWVAGALEHIAHEPDLDGRAFHLTDPRRQRVDELINEFATAAHAPRFAVSIDKRLTDPLPTWPLSLALALPPWRQAENLALRELGIPEEVLAHMELVPRFDTREAARALAGSPLESRRRCTSTRSGCGTTGSARWTRAWRADARCSEALEGKHVMITGASSGIGRAAALKVAAAGGVPLLVARNVEKLEETARGDRRRGRHRVRVRGRHRPTWSRSSAWSSACSPTIATWTCSSTTPGARSGARSR